MRKLTGVGDWQDIANGRFLGTCCGWLLVNGTDHGHRGQWRSDVKRMNISLHLDMLILKYLWYFREDSPVSCWVDGAGAQMRRPFLSYLCIWCQKAWKTSSKENLSRVRFLVQSFKCLQRWPLSPWAYCSQELFLNVRLTHHLFFLTHGEPLSPLYII